jgi:hypothetical protein
MTFIDAACQVLKANNKFLAAEEIVNEAIAKGLLVTHSRKPAATMWSVLYNDNKAKQKRGQRPRFVYENGAWGLMEWCGGPCSIGG